MMKSLTSMIHISQPLEDAIVRPCGLIGISSLNCNCWRQRGKPRLPEPGDNHLHSTAHPGHECEALFLAPASGVGSLLTQVDSVGTRSLSQQQTRLWEKRQGVGREG